MPVPVNGVRVMVPTYVPGWVIAAMFTPTERVAGVTLLFELTTRKLFVEFVAIWINCDEASKLVTVRF